jgi:hypothetical protein
VCVIGARGDLETIKEFTGIAIGLMIQGVALVMHMRVTVAVAVALL